ncbi:hypothetical protein ACHAPT_005299 [Fusarium lateritium]
MTKHRHAFEYFRSKKDAESKFDVCLSYTWRPQHPGRHIYVEGEHINEGVAEVGKNLGDFLGAARDANVTDWLRIDALCINQQDLAEKEHQVRQMGQTYKRAEKVFVWLGLIDEPTMHVLEDMMRVMKEATNLKNIAIIDDLSTTREDLLNGLSTIMSVPYWTRVWIAQEVQLHAEPTLFFENCQMNIHKLALFLGSVTEWYEDSGLEGLPAWKYLWWRLVRYEGPRDPRDGSVSLASLMRQFAESGCQDKRDRVYALLSLADDGDPELVNYTVSVDAVFRNTMALMKSHKRPLDELLLIGEALIEALELWPTTNPSSSTLDINFDGTEDVTLLTWSYATLKTLGATEEIPSETIDATCMYVGIRDGPDVHVFEYAVDRAAERSSEALSWQGYNRPRTSLVFETAVQDVLNELREQRRCVQPPRAPQAPRSITIRWPPDRETNEAQEVEESDGGEGD